MRLVALRFDETVPDAALLRVIDHVDHQTSDIQRAIQDTSAIPTIDGDDTSLEKNIEPWDTYLDSGLFEESRYESHSQEFLSVSGQNFIQQQLLREIYIASNNLSDGRTVWKTSLIYQMLKDDHLLPYWVPEKSPVAQAIARTLLPEAIASHDVSLVNTLLLTGIDLDSSLDDFTSKTPLNLAIDEDNIEITHLLLNRGADANFYGPYDHPLIQAVIYGRLDLVSLLIQYGADVNAHSDKYPLTYGFFCPTPLTIAARNGHIWLARLLIANGADVSPNYVATPPLRAAAFSGQLDIVRLLLEMGAADAHSAMAQAASRGHEDIVESIARQRQGTFSKEFLDTNRLHAAVRSGNTKVVQRLLASGVRDDSSATIWKTALRLVGQPHDVTIIQLLLKHGTKATSRNLIKAIWDGNVQVAELLLRYGTQICAQPDYPLQFNCNTGTHIEMVTLLLHHGLDLRVHGLRILVHAIYHWRSLDVARLILAHAECYDGLDIVSENDVKAGKRLRTYCEDPSQDQTPEIRESPYSILWHASEIKDHDAAFDMSVFLFDKGARIMDGPLQIAARKGHLRLVEFLIDKGADINAVVEPGAHCLTALDGATRFGDLSLIHLLLSHGAKATGIELRSAVESNNISVTSLYISLGADVNAPLNHKLERETALQLAARYGNLELVRVLLDAGVDVEYQAHDDNFAYPALQQAVRRGAIDVVKELVQRGADVNAPAVGYCEHTALEMAAMVGHLDLVQLLINLQAEIQGSRALTLALRNGHCGVATLLRRYMSQEEGGDSRDIREVSTVS